MQLQTPPRYSALKHKGKPLYYYARRGIDVTKPPREIDIDVLQRIDGNFGLSGNEAELSLKIVCSKGTYIRTLAADIGEFLGCGAHLVQLRRKKSGCFSVDSGLTIDDFAADDAKSRFLAKMLSVEEVGKLLQLSKELDRV